jgi:predicted acyl esterase
MNRTSQPRHDLLIEKDIEIPVSDGARLKADIFRPKAGGRFPVIMNIGGYRKDKIWVPPLDLEEKANPYITAPITMSATIPCTRVVAWPLTCCCR